MKFKTARAAIAWAYEYCDRARCAQSPNLDPEYIYTPAKSADHARHALAVKILGMVGGYVDPENAIHSHLGYFAGWIRWNALSGPEKYRIRRLAGKVKQELIREGLM